MGVLHGFLGSSRNVASLTRGLAARVPDLDVVALDLTGHGASPPLPPDADLATLAADVLETLHAIAAAGPLALVGHSLGGRVALRAALLEPAALADVVLLDIGPSPVADSVEMSRLLELLLDAPDAAAHRETFRDHFRAGGLDETLVDWLLLNLRHEGDAYRWRVDRRALVALRARTAGEDLWRAVEGPRPWRARCVRGERSGYVDAREAGRLGAAGCPVETVPDAGHFLHVERPAAVLDALTRHFTGTAGTRTG